MSIFATTLISRSCSEILARISQVSKAYPSHPLLFAVSSNADASSLSQLAQALTNFSSQTIGCISAPFPRTGFREQISCSLAVLDSKYVVPFRSTIPGKAAPQVGRWHSYRNRNQESPTSSGPPETLPEGRDDWSNVWDQPPLTALPSTLSNVEPTSVSSIVYFSDSAPEGLSNALGALSCATKLGLSASSTPFVTGRPFTLFHNQNIYDSGAVGFAVKCRLPPQLDLDYVGLKAISEPLCVTESEGNLVITLNGGNPAQILLSSMQKSGLQMDSASLLKDDEQFFLATLSEENSKPAQMHEITAGDPSRGTISLRTPLAPSIGSSVRFYHRSNATPVELPDSLHSESLQTTDPTLRFVAVSDVLPEQPLGEADVKELRDVFWCASENGFVVSRQAEPTWTCTVPGAVASLQF